MVYIVSVMKRTNIYLTERQIKELKKQATKIGISTSELIRRILDQYLNSTQKR
jgi:predicted DNA binding CopG/RHH family protein